jgi:hypothetical protein
MKTQSKKDIILDTIILPQLKECGNIQEVSDYLTAAVAVWGIHPTTAVMLTKLWVRWNAPANLDGYLNGTCPVYEWLGTNQPAGTLNIPEEVLALLPQ